MFPSKSEIRKEGDGMAKINVLPKSVAELIAAGEVVERPASAVKELIENSIDAGADSVTVEIKNGGIRYIRVTDNGSGIHREDVRTAFISHATSKISTSEDLNSIFTLGFRGEALPSIAAVSRLSMLTKSSDEQVGTLIEIEGGEEKYFDDAGCPDGTTIIIKDLFYNTPARMKFLKKDVTEGAYVSDIVSKTAIAHPEVRFTFIRDGKQILTTPGNSNLKDAVFAVHGKEISDGLIPCEYEYKFIKIRGFISRPLNNRPNRNLQYCFVNGRYVRMSVTAAALDEAYKNRIMVGKFPMCFLFIDIPADKTDVNVHPAKTEIRFSDDSGIFEALFYAAKNALNKGDNVRPEVVLKDKSDLLAKAVPTSTQMKFVQNVSSVTSNETVLESSVEHLQNNKNVHIVVNDDSDNSCKSVFNTEIKKNPIFENNNSSNKENILSSVPTTAVFRDTTGFFDNLTPKEEVRKNDCFGRSITSDEKDTSDVAKSETFLSESTENPVKDTNIVNIDNKEISQEACVVIPEDEAVSDFRIVGEIFKTYILVECENKLYIIDKHAAHERMIFNKLTENGFSEDSQILLSPAVVHLSVKEHAAVMENINVFTDGGFSVEDFGTSSILVRACPVTLQNEDVAFIITEMAGELLRGNLKPIPEKLDRLYHTTACRAAIKAGDDLKKEETESFVRALLSDESIRYCPHGRPVMYELSKSEIEKQFGRI